MKLRIALLVAAASLASAASAVTPVGHAAPAAPFAFAKTCRAGYVHANLSWGEKCLRAGEFCKVGNREYRRYGFYCPPSGHLRRLRR
jgi:hypothetical protein